MASLLIVVACIWTARWFARQAAKPLDTFDTNDFTGRDTLSAVRPQARQDQIHDATRLSAIVNELLSRFGPASATQPAGLDAFQALLGPGAATVAGDPPDVPIPPFATRNFSHGAVSGSPANALAVYRTTASMSEVKAFFDRMMPANGWTPEGSAHPADDARCFLRFARGDRACMILCTREPDSSEAMLVVQTTAPPDGAP